MGYSSSTHANSMMDMVLLGQMMTEKMTEK